MSPSRTAFDPVAADYDAYRPAYPDELFDTIEQYAGPLAGTVVLDLAAGTGIATRAMTARGARVVASDLGADMLHVLTARSPATPAVQARGEQLPFVDGSFGLITCATAWHWIGTDRRAAEAFRLLGTGGVLAVWWAFGGLDEDEEVTERERAVYERWRVGKRELVTPDPQVGDETELLPAAGFADVEVRQVRATRTVTIAEHVGHLSTHSPVLALRADLPGFRADLLAAYEGQDTVVEQVFCHLVLARRPQ